MKRTEDDEPLRVLLIGGGSAARGVRRAVTAHPEARWAVLGTPERPYPAASGKASADIVLVDLEGAERAEDLVEIEHDAEPTVPLVIVGGAPPLELTDLESVSVLADAADIGPFGILHELEAVLRERRLTRELADAKRERDVTETSLHEFVDRLPDATLVIDADGSVRFANGAASRLFGRAGEALLGQPFGHPATAGQATEMEVIRPTGETLIVELRVSPTLWFGERVFLASLRDVSDLRRLERVTRRLGGRLEKLHREVEKLGRVLTDRFSLPLADLAQTLGRARASAAEGGDGGLAEDLERSLASVELMRAVAGNVEQLARTADPLEGATVVEMERVFEAALDELNDVDFDARGHVDCDPLPAVYGDEVELTQLCLHLIRWAVESDGAASGRLEVTVDEDEDDWMFEFRGGSGAYPADLGPNALDLAELALTASDEAGGSARLGLAMCQRIVERHGGVLWVESSEGGEALVGFRLPKRGA